MKQKDIVQVLWPREPEENLIAVKFWVLSVFRPGWRYVRVPVPEQDHAILGKTQDIPEVDQCQLQRQHGSSEGSKGTGREGHQGKSLMINIGRN